MDIHFLTPFPEMINSILNESILSRSASKGIVKYNIYNLFDFLLYLLSLIWYYISIKSIEKGGMFLSSISINQSP